MSEPSRSILVINDNRWLRDELVGLLRDDGYPATGVADGRQALERLRAAPAPGLILLDVHMPVLDGLGFFAEQQADPRLRAQR